ncbi:hypothetical protein QP446_04050 [Corynebacterium riegelii]|uniref:hypothetical protein n=1 Tax=Corynebacterium riegelii TaxID=156976 RepID=UPI00254FC411|nr:hypothetical protein [Corynebacterium riegelii]MDK7179940.1 hypothetical protein [Corynebacterium riegelii]
MGFLRLMNLDGLLLEVPDALLGSVFAAAKAGHARGDFVSLCAFDSEERRYIQVDTCVFVPEITNPDGETFVDENHVMFLAPVFTGKREVPADQAVVDQLLKVMKETDGCIVLSAEDELVLSPDAAKRIVRSARRINPFEDVTFPTPGH